VIRGQERIGTNVTNANESEVLNLSETENVRPWKPTHRLRLEAYENNGHGGAGDLIQQIDEYVMELPGLHHPNDPERPGKWYQRASEVHRPHANNPPPEISYYSYPEPHMHGFGSWAMYSLRFQNVVYRGTLTELKECDDANI
jgi:hypothetical protein